MIILVQINIWEMPVNLYHYTARF